MGDGVQRSDAAANQRILRDAEWAERRYVDVRSWAGSRFKWESVLRHRQWRLGRRIQLWR